MQVQQQEGQSQTRGIANDRYIFKRVENSTNAVAAPTRGHDHDHNCDHHCNHAHDHDPVTITMTV